jgi:hypothetical protein
MLSAEGVRAGSQQWLKNRAAAMLRSARYCGERSPACLPIREAKDGVIGCRRVPDGSRVQCLGQVRGRVCAIAEIDAILARQAPKCDPPLPSQATHTRLIADRLARSDKPCSG